VIVRTTQRSHSPTTPRDPHPFAVPTDIPCQPRMVSQLCSLLSHACTSNGGGAPLEVVTPYLCLKMKPFNCNGHFCVVATVQ
jgi:hypothetical protein